MKIDKELLKQFRETVLLKHKSLCRRCQKTDTVAARQIYRKNFTFDENNYICLCAKCCKKLKKSELGYIIECLRLMQKNI